MTVVIHIVGVVLENGLLTILLRSYMWQETLAFLQGQLLQAQEHINIAFPSFIKYSIVSLLLSLYQGKAFKVCSRSSEMS